MYICKVTDINEAESKGFEVLGESIFIVKMDGQLHAYKNICPHIQINLEYNPDQFLNDEKNFIQCSNHNALFEIDTGTCIAGPCSGQSLQKFDIQIINDEVHSTKH